MSNKCEICSARARLFVCKDCSAKLHDKLTRLAHGPTVRGRITQGLLADLADVVLKRTRLGTGSGHRKKGDELPVLYLPDGTRRVKDKETGEMVDTTILSPQGRAGQLLGSARNSLTTIIRDLCEHRGLQSPALDELAAMADWLAGHTHAIACDPAAKVWYVEIDALVVNIERTVDRPVKRTWLIDCPTWDDAVGKACGTPLFATEDAIEVYCRTCRTTHSCSRMKLLRQSDLERERLTWDWLLKANNLQDVGFRVPLRTLQKWRQDGSLKPRGWLRPDGGRGDDEHTEDDEPLYLWSDVRKLRERKPQKAATGGAVHRRMG